MYDVIPYPDNDNALINSLLADIKKSGDNKNYNDFKRFTESLSLHGFEINTKFKKNALRKIEDDLYELRPLKFRIMVTHFQNVFYLLNGFFKDTNKTPNKEKEIAKHYIQEIKQNTK